MKMKQQRSLVWRILPWALLVILLAGFAYVLYLVYSGTGEEAISDPPFVAAYDGDNAPLKMENDALLFEMDGKTTQFTVTDKKTGKVWYSNPENRNADPVALSSNKDALSATMNITYTFSGGEIELNNYTYSLENQTYRIIPQEDGSIRVDYAIGKIEKNYMIPSAITVERFQQFTDKMSKKKCPWAADSLSWLQLARPMHLKNGK